MKRTKGDYRQGNKTTLRLTRKRLIPPKRRGNLCRWRQLNRVRGPERVDEPPVKDPVQTTGQSCVSKSPIDTTYEHVHQSSQATHVRNIDNGAHASCSNSHIYNSSVSNVLPIHHSKLVYDHSKRPACVGYHANVSKTLKRKYKQISRVQRTCYRFPHKPEECMTLLSTKLQVGSRAVRRSEAERLVKWSILARKKLVTHIVRNFKSIQGKCNVALTRLRECAARGEHDKMTALCGVDKHTVHTEPYFCKYQCLRSDFQPIVIDSSGVGANVFEEYNISDRTHGNTTYSWHCNSQLCNVSNAYVRSRVERLCKTISKTALPRVSAFINGIDNCSSYSRTLKVGKLGHPISCHVRKGKCPSRLLLLQTVAPHYPEVRVMLGLLAKIIVEHKKIYKIDTALRLGHMHILQPIANVAKTHAESYAENVPTTISEETILETYKNAFAALRNRDMDTPVNICVSCEKLCYRKYVMALQQIRVPITHCMWQTLLDAQELRGVAATYICKFCALKFRSGTIPPTCILNNLEVQPTPRVISCLNDYEKILIQRARAFQVVVRMNTVCGSRAHPTELIRKVIGRTFHLPLPLNETLRHLPHAEDPLNIHPDVIILVRGVPTNNKTVWEDLVDVNAVYRALEFLKGHNKLYSSIRLPQDPQNILQDLVEEDLEVMADDPTDSTADKESTPLQQLPPNNTNQTDGLLRLIPPDDAANNYKHYTIQPLYTERDSRSATAMYQMLKVQSMPLDNRDVDLDIKCFPDLYPFGMNGQFEKRVVPLSPFEYVKARLMSCHSQFRLNQQYLFYLLHQCNLRQINSGIFHKMNVVRPGNKMTAGTWLKAVADGTLDTELTTIFSRLRNTPQFWVIPRNNLRCMNDHYGPATWFLTLSPSEWAWEDLGSYLRKINPSIPNSVTLHELVATDPVSTSRFIDNKFRAMLDFLTSKDAPLGKVSHYFWRREYQGRGLQHFHLLLWVEGAPTLGVSAQEEVAAFILKYISCTLPNPESCPTLFQRVDRYQRHKHNSYCLRKKKTKHGHKTVCRFSFPRNTTDKLVMRNVSISIAGRKRLRTNTRLYDLPRTQLELYINDYNPAVLLAWIGNIDIQYVGEVSALIVWYVTKYLCKSEKATGDEDFNDINSTKSLQSRLYSMGVRCLTHRECGALEAADTLLGIPLHGTDPSTSIRWLDVNQVRSRRLLCRKDVEALHADSTDIFWRTWIDDHYPQRPIALEATHLADFTRFFDIITVRPVNSNNTVYELSNGTYLRRRANPYLLNHYRYNEAQEPEKYYYALLLLYKPWRDTDDLKCGQETFKAAFEFCKNDIPDALTHHERIITMQHTFDKGVKDVHAELNNTDEDDVSPTCDTADNPLAYNAVEAHSAMQEFHDITQLADVSETTVNQLVDGLNTDQLRIFNTVTQAVQRTDDNGDNILRLFVSGVGGTGKSYLIHTIKTWIKYHLKADVAVGAPTGIAAFNVGGLTIYRLFQLPVEHGQTPRYTELSDQSLKVIREQMKFVKLIILDEISMISNLTLIYIHLRLSEIFNTKTHPNGWFGHIHILLLGDLLQLPPVHDHPPFMKLQQAVVDKKLGALGTFDVWASAITFDELTINMRQSGDTDFAQLLSRIRLGIVLESDLEVLHEKKIPLHSTTCDGRLAELVAYIQTLPPSTVCLFTTRDHCDRLNTAMLNTLSTTDIHLIAEDTFDCAPFLKKKVHRLMGLYEDDSSRTAGLEKHIIIRVGCKVMLRRNIDVTVGLVNGAMGVVLSVETSIDNNNDVTGVLILFNETSGKTHEHMLKKVKSKFEVMDRAYVHRLQFPINLSYGITIHKSQGLTLQNIVADIGTSTFTCGQAYVALSRVRSLNGLHLINFSPSIVNAKREAVLEYERLRAIFKPDQDVTPRSTHKRKLKIYDRCWLPLKCVQKVQTQCADTHSSHLDASTYSAFMNTDMVSCYANATLQCLFNIPILRQHIIHSDTNVPLQQLVEQYIDKVQLLDALPVRRHIGDPFNRSQQQDAAEFLLALSEHSQPIKSTFAHCQSVITECTSCGHSHTQQDSNVFLRLYTTKKPKDRYLQLQDLFEASTQWETLHDVRCGKCHAATVRRRMNVTQAEHFLVMHFITWLNESTHVNLKLSGIPSTRIGIAGNTYRPIAAIMHNGNTIHSGHYVSYLRNRSGWILADDARVQPARWPKLSQNMYILILEKVPQATKRPFVLGDM